MKSLSKSLVAAGLATALTLSAAPAYAQSSEPAPTTDTTTTQTDNSMAPGTIGALVGSSVVGLGAALATQGQAPLLDIAKIQEGFSNPALMPYAAAFTAGILGLGAVIGTMIANAVG
ncbi:hypothetical protein [Corynebacterium sp. H130]|uniref:hypothetical protein n=1 Tax=Corynebacterium sp. H130 TaxID=3133444 RepID=UPI0030A8893B